MKSVHERLEEELQELLHRAVTLESFTETAKYDTLDDTDKELIRDQLSVMEEYATVLEQRIDNLG